LRGTERSFITDNSLLFNFYHFNPFKGGVLCHAC
jgi:hypothetical protein